MARSEPLSGLPVEPRIPRDHRNTMVSNLLSKVFGSRNKRLMKTMDKTVNRINALEAKISAMDDAALRAKTDEFRQRYHDGASLDKLLPDAFAVVREAG